jgi:general secretion pathway protein C
MQPASWSRALIVLATIIASGYLIARGVNDLIVASLLLDATRAARPRPAPSAASPTTSQQTDPDSRAILARNAFDPTTGPLWPPVARAPATPAPPPEPAPEQVPRCEIETRIAATLYNERDPERSVVVLRGPRLGAGRPYTVGTSVLADLAVAEIRPQAVMLRNAGSACWLGMFNERSRAKVARERAASQTQRFASGKASAANKSRASHRARRPLSATELQTGIEKIGEHRFQLTRPLLDKVRERSWDIARSTRLAPEHVAGRLVGMRLVRMRRNGLLSRLGLQRGDVLRTLNGHPIADANALFEAYAGVLRSSRLTLALERNRRLMTLEYYVR